VRGGRSIAARACGVLLTVLAAVGSTPAFAQDSAPAVSRLIADPSDPRELALSSNFGLLLSHDAGSSWDFRCKAALGYRGNEPAFAILPGGTLVLGVSAGILTADKAGCEFTPGRGIEPNVVDVAALMETPGAALAVSVRVATSSSRLWRSLDGARTFQALGAELPHFTALSLAAPAALPKRVYLTGLVWEQSVRGAFAVSNDAGQHFSITTLPNSDSGAQPFIAGINPQHPDTIYLRFTGLPGRVQVSDDAGRSFRDVLSIPGPVQGFALSPSGDRVFVSSLESGIYQADSAALTFERTSAVGVPCLLSTGDSLLACGHRAQNGFLVGRSLDAGRGFRALLDTAGISPAVCGPQTTVGAICSESWPRIAAQLRPNHAVTAPAPSAASVVSPAAPSAKTPARGWSVVLIELVATMLSWLGLR